MDGKQLFTTLDKNISPKLLNIKFRDKYNNGVFCAVCPRVIRVNDTNGKHVEKYTLVGLDGKFIK